MLNGGVRGTEPRPLEEAMNISTATFNRCLCAGALVLAVLPVMGQGRPESGRGWGPRGGVCGNFTGLTEAQRATLSDLEAKNEPAMEAKRKAAQDANDALRQAMAKPSTDRATLKALFDKESQARFAMLEAHRSFRQEVEKVLTPEQKAQWERRQGDGPGMGWGRGGGMGRGWGMRGGMGMRGDMGMRGGRGMGRGDGSCPMGER